MAGINGYAGESDSGSGGGGEFLEPKKYEAKLPGYARGEGTSEEGQRYSEEDLFNIKDQWDRERATFSRDELVEMVTSWDVPEEDAKRLVDNYNPGKEINYGNQIEVAQSRSQEKGLAAEVAEDRFIIPQEGGPSFWELFTTPFRITTSWRRTYNMSRQTVFGEGITGRILNSVSTTAITLGSMFPAGLAFLNFYLMSPKLFPYAIGFAIATNARDIYQNIKSIESSRSGESKD